MFQETVNNSPEEIVEMTNRGEEETGKVVEELKLLFNKETTVCKRMVLISIR